MPLIIEHNCGHETEVQTSSTQGRKERTKVPAMCPTCDAEADLLTCSRCGGQHTRAETTIIITANACLDPGCQQDRAEANRRIIPG